jgi:hypothetical protein
MMQAAPISESGLFESYFREYNCDFRGHRLVPETPPRMSSISVATEVTPGIDAASFFAC